MMLLGVLYDLSDRELCTEIRMHAGMRWFCGQNFHDPVPDHSTLSRLRNERWTESGLFERLMDEVLRQCCEVGLVSGRHLSVDGTEVRADVSMRSFESRGAQPPDDADQQAPGSGGKEPKPAGQWQGRGKRYKNETHFSPTDPDARLYRKGHGREAGPSYLAHDLIDTKSCVILRRKASLARGTAERDTAREMLGEILQSRGDLGLPNEPEILTGDAGYGASDFITELLERDIEPHVPLLSGEAKEEVPTWKRRTFTLKQKRARHRKVEQAKARNRVRDIQQTRGYAISRKLRIRSEHLFAEGKNQHGLARARRRGFARVQSQLTLSAVVQNLKRLVTFSARTGRGRIAAAAQPSLCPHRGLPFAPIRPRSGHDSLHRRQHLIRPPCASAPPAAAPVPNAVESFAFFNSLLEAPATVTTEEGPSLGPRRTRTGALRSAHAARDLSGRAELRGSGLDLAPRPFCQCT